MIVVVFGGTGTLGTELSKILKKEKDCKVHVVSRCELRQKEHAKEFGFNYTLGDVSNSQWRSQLPDVADYVINLAASKHVEVCEENVEYCVKVNYEGVVNTYNYARDVGAKYLYVTTDKAVRPVNAYGAAKMLGEKFIADKKDASTFRWANVCGSRGSVFHLFREQVKKGVVTITDRRMTRLWLHIEDVASFMWKNRDSNEKHLVPKMKAAKLIDIAYAIAEVEGCKKPKFKEIGFRPGEKLNEEVLYNPFDDESLLNSVNSQQFKKHELIEFIRRVLAC